MHVCYERHVQEAGTPEVLLEKVLERLPPHFLATRG